MTATQHAWSSLTESNRRAHRRVRDVITAGFVDPLKVTRSPLEDAASIAALLLTTDALVAEEIQRVTGQIMAPGFGDLAEGLPRPSSDAATRSL